MSQPSLRVVDYLEHILAAITRIQRYTVGITEQEFSTNELVADAVIRNLEVMGEAAKISKFMRQHLQPTIQSSG